jgi:hypothetical protein
MEPAPNQACPTPAHDDTESRLGKLERTVTDLQCDNALLRQRMDSGFAAVQAQFALTEEKLRREFHDGVHALEQRLAAKIEAESQRLETKPDPLIKWLIGAQVTTMAFVAGIAIQLFLR